VSSSQFLFFHNTTNNIISFISLSFSCVIELYKKLLLMSGCYLHSTMKFVAKHSDKSIDILMTGTSSLFDLWIRSTGMKAIFHSIL